LTPSPAIPFYLRAVRAALRRLNAFISRRYDRDEAVTHPPPETQPPARFQEAEAQLRQLDVEGGEFGRAYFEKHIPRLARTLTLVPQSVNAGAILELGCYGQITPFLRSFCGYSNVRGAHLGPAGETEDKYIQVNGKTITVKVDFFNAELDPFPYPDATFETVVIGELIEHLLHDPIHMLLECRRVLIEGGRILVTTPNVASLTSVARVLHGYDNPQIYSHYSLPSHGAEDIPHVREYTPFELRDTIIAAGFEIETLITEPIAEWSKNLPMLHFLESHGYNTSLRGEQTYCVAVKREALPVDRYPVFLYF
jgi:SAM-dependent methyltransferase